MCCVPVLHTAEQKDALRLEAEFAGSGPAVEHKLNQRLAVEMFHLEPQETGLRAGARLVISHGTSGGTESVAAKSLTLSRIGSGSKAAVSHLAHSRSLSVKGGCGVQTPYLLSLGTDCNHL